MPRVFGLLNLETIRSMSLVVQRSLFSLRKNSDTSSPLLRRKERLHGLSFSLSHFISFYLFIQDCRKEHCTYQATFLLRGRWWYALENDNNYVQGKTGQQRA